METPQKQSRLHQSLYNPRFYRVVNVAFTLLFGWVLVLIVLFNTGVAVGYAWYWLLPALVLGAGLCFAVSRLWRLLPIPSKRFEVCLVCVLLLLLVAAQVFAGFSLQLAPAFARAPGVAVGFATAYATNGQAPAAAELLAGDRGAYLLLSAFCSLLHWLGVRNFALPLLVLNMVAIDTAVLLAYLCCRRFFGVNRALLLLLGMVLALPFLLSAPLPSAVTLALPFPVGLVLLWNAARGYWRQGKLRAVTGRLCALAVLAAVGALLHGSVLFVFLAMLVDLLVLLRGQWRVLLSLGCLALCGLLVFLGVLALRYTPVMPSYSPDDRLPAKAWVMMGLSDYGVYNAADHQLLLSQPGAGARGAVATAEIRSRMAGYGFWGMVQHIGTKLSHSFGDPLLGSAVFLEAAPGAPAFMGELFTTQGVRYPTVAYAGFAAFCAVLFWMVAGACKSMFRSNNALSFVRLALVVMVVCMMVLEGGARHLLAVLPLLMLCAVEASPLSAPAVQSRQKRSRTAAGVEARVPVLSVVADTPDYMDPGFGLPQTNQAGMARADLLQDSKLPAEDDMPRLLWNGDDAAAIVQPLPLGETEGLAEALEGLLPSKEPAAKPLPYGQEIDAQSRELFAMLEAEMPQVPVPEPAWDERAASLPPGGADNGVWKRL